VIDTNAAFISERITSAGAQVVRRVTVGDDVEQIMEAIARAMQRVDLVITTGGLGPTSDDLTKKAITKYFKRPLIFHEDVLEDIEKRFKARGITMPVINQNQALLPQGATFIPNTRGSAVGIVIEENGRLFVSIPGVPHEMEAMVEGWVADTIRKRSGDFVTLHRRIHTVGIFESALFEKIADLAEPRQVGDSKLMVAFLPSPRGVDLRLTATTRDSHEGQRLVDELESKIDERIGNYVYGYDSDTLPEVVGKLLRIKKMTLAVAESCTGGFLGKVITDIPGSSDYFLGGIIAYSNEIKIKHLSVPPDILANQGAVSEECARFMAEGARKSFGSDIAVSITGIAGPTGETEEKPIGLTFIGLSTIDKIVVKEHRFIGDRERIRERCTTIALDMTRKHLKGDLGRLPLGS
jgi:nicotinamide-nucleotide amidase